MTDNRLKKEGEREIRVNVAVEIRKRGTYDRRHDATIRAVDDNQDEKTADIYIYIFFFIYKKSLDSL